MHLRQYGVRMLGFRVSVCKGRVEVDGTSSRSADAASGGLHLGEIVLHYRVVLVDGSHPPGVGLR